MAVFPRVLAAGICMWALAPAFADDTTISLTLKDHKFAPAEPTAPANTPLTVEVANEDATAAESESKDLKVEKVVAAHGRISVHVRALPPGRYRFFDDYHEATTEGFLVVK